MKEEIYRAIRTDLILREKIARVLEVQAATVYAYAVRRSERLEMFKSVEVIRGHLGLKSSEILESRDGR